MLGELLPIIYTLRQSNPEAWKTIRRSECDLDDWLDALPDCLNVTRQRLGQLPARSGLSSLWFYYLSVKLVLNRLALKVRSAIVHGIQTLI